MQENLNSTVILVLVFTLVLLIMGIFVLVLFLRYNKTLRRQQKEALENLIIGQENERERLSRDLHDEMGAELADIIYNLNKIKTSETEVIDIKLEVNNKLKNASNKIRRIAHDLLPSILSDYSLAALLNELVREYSSKPINIEFTSDCGNIKLNKKTELHLYRIIKELIHNTEKHSGANLIRILFTCDSVTQVFQFNYSDNGNGLNKKAINPGIGLKNITTRVNLMNGKMQMDGDEGFNFVMKLSSVDYE